MSGLIENSDAARAADAQSITPALAGPYDPPQLQLKPQVVQDKRALAIVYADARLFMDRLDGVLGAGGWRDEYEELPDGTVICRLSCRIAGEWLTKMDVGGPSDQKD